MHKARENPNGSFSIGKTWMLDDLATIESFTGSQSTNYEDQRRKQWAGDSGVLVTIQKPYYWQAATSKEKDFFIGSLIKIYRKYTGGKLPQLIGFTSQELSEFTATAGQRPRTPQTPVSRPGPAPLPGKAPSSEYPQTPPRAVNREPSRELKLQPSNDSGLRRGDSEERTSATPGQFPPSDFVRNLRPPDPRTRSQPSRSESPALNSYRDGSSNPPSPQAERSLRSLASGTSVDSFKSREGSRDGPPTGPLPNFDRLRTNKTHSPVGRVETPPQLAPPRSPERGLLTSLRAGSGSNVQSKQEQLPERRRPPISIPTTQIESTPDSPQDFSTPSEKAALPFGPSLSQINQLENSNGGQGQGQSQSRFVDPLGQQTQSQVAKGLNTSEPLNDMLPAAEGAQTLPAALSQLSQLSSPATPTSPPEAPAPEEVHRPGLGPMIKKKSTKDIANAFRKAAAAHNAFKPRTGGAAEKVRDEMLKTPHTPDGINGVFPAPSMLRDISQENLKSPTALPTLATRPLSPEPLRIVPDVTVTPSPAPAPVASEAATTNTLRRPSPSPERQTPSPSSVQDERLRKRRSNHSAKYAKALGIDHTLLEGRTIDIESALTDFGWGDGEIVKTTYDDLQNAIKRDLAKVEMGSWLGTFEHTDERVAIVGTMLDKAIAECEELDGLLTLYNVELGVSTLFWHLVERY